MGTDHVDNPDPSLRARIEAPERSEDNPDDQPPQLHGEANSVAMSGVAESEFVQAIDPIAAPATNGGDAP